LHSSVMDMLLPVLKEGSVKMFSLYRTGFRGDPEMVQSIVDSVDVSLNVLSLSWNEIGSQGVRVIADFLATNPSLKELHLRDRLVDNDAEVLSDALRDNTELRGLALRGNQITAIGRKHLLRALFDTTNLNTCAASNHTCRVWDLTPDISGVNKYTDPAANRAMKIFTVLAASNQSFFEVSCIGDASYKLIPMALSLAQSFTPELSDVYEVHTETPELSDVYEDQTGKKSADWGKLKPSCVPLTSVFELLRCWAVPHGAPLELAAQPAESRLRG